MANKEWTYKDKLMVDLENQYEEYPDHFVFCYSSDTDYYYLTMNSSEPIDKWGAEWEPTSECLALTSQDLDNLIEKLQELR